MKYYGKIQDPKDLVTKEYTDQKYTKPNTGIPDTDLADAVRTSLGKADTALQQHQSLTAYRTAAAQDVIDAAQDAEIAAAQPYSVNATVSPLDYSCVMDKTIAEIDAAVRDGRPIRLVVSIAGGYGEAFTFAAVYETDPDCTYGSLNALGIFNTGDHEEWVSLVSSITDDGTHNTMSLVINPFNVPSSPSDIGAQLEITTSGILKGQGYGSVVPATAGVDYLAPAALTPYRTAAAQDVIDQTQAAAINAKSTVEVWRLD